MSKVNNKLRKLSALKRDNSRGLQYFIDEASRILGNPIVLYDIDWKILSYTQGVVTDDPVWNNHVNSETVDDNIDIFIYEGFIDVMIKADKVVILNGEKLKYDRMFGKIFDKDNTIMAGISVIANNKPFDDDDIIVAEAICKTLSGEICKIPYYQNYAQAKLDIYINMLIDGEIKNKLYVSGYVEMIYKGLKNDLYLAVADISKCDPVYARLEYYRGLFKRLRPAFKYSIYSNYIVIIMSTDETVFYPKRCLSRLNKLFKQDNIKVGISSRFENLFELQRYYSEAVKVLTNGLKVGETEQIFVYGNEDDLCVKT